MYSCTHRPHQRARKYKRIGHKRVCFRETKQCLISNSCSNRKDRETPSPILHSLIIRCSKKYQHWTLLNRDTSFAIPSLRTKLWPVCKMPATAPSLRYRTSAAPSLFSGILIFHCNTKLQVLYYIERVYFLAS